MDIDKIKSWLKDKWIYLLIAIIVIPLAIFMICLNIRGNNKDFAVSGSHLIIVKEGMTTTDIAMLLHEKKLVRDADAFCMEARFKGLSEKLKAGPYQIEGGLSNGEIVSVMAKGHIKQVRFTVPEGYTVVKTAKKLEAEGLGTSTKFIEAARKYAPYSYMQTDNPNVLFTAEGFIFPATYDFPVGMEEEKMLQIMVQQFDKEMHSAGINEEIDKRGLNLRDVINMAAMVELEAVFADEQPRIAGVFLKRIDIGMPIQSDTTIQYILGVQKEIITFADTEIKNPYNTYQNIGLPPGPIASPGMGAIKAVLAPEVTDYLYFVAQNDGYHRFSKTYEEHLQAIKDIG